jgi:serine phosphatase RsbU (regulator of sigma subunit)
LTRQEENQGDSMRPEKHITVDVGFAKTEKYASRQSGDTVELIERPGGGFSLVMIDGQGSGKAAKTLSLLLSAKAVGLIKDGVRDGAVARATHDHLFAFRHGQVSATFDLLSVDMTTRTIVVTRNAEAPLLLLQGGETRVIPVSSGPIGRYQWTRPEVMQFPVKAGVTIAMFTDGIPHSGRRGQLPAVDFEALASRTLLADRSATDISDAILLHALERDTERPGDDMAVVVVKIREEEAPIAVRRLSAQFPVR